MDLAPRVRRLRRRAIPPWQHTQRLLHDLQLLVFEVTQRCNLSCRHCGSDCRQGADQPDLPADTVIRVLEEVAAKWDPRRITVMIGGGEPLLYPGVFDLGARIRRLGFHWGMVTNGVLWDEAEFRAVRAARPASLSVSLDGMKEEHEWLRGQAGDWETTVRTIRYFAGLRRGPTMDVITCVGPHNLGALPRLFELLRELGVPGWRLIPISPIGRAKADRDLLLDRDGFRTLLTQIMAFRRQDALPVYLSESNYVGGCLEREVRDHDYFCRAGISVGGVMVNGDILACASIDRRFSQGNVHRDSFVDVWEHRFQVFRDRRWMRKGACATCGEWKWCLGNSFHNWDLDADRTGLCHYRDYDLADLPVDRTVPVVRRRPGPRPR